jgi:hypothetical protein
VLLLKLFVLLKLSKLALPVRAAKAVRAAAKAEQILCCC